MEGRARTERSRTDPPRVAPRAPDPHPAEPVPAEPPEFADPVVAVLAVVSEDLRLFGDDPDERPPTVLLDRLRKIPAVHAAWLAPTDRLPPACQAAGLYQWEVGHLRDRRTFGVQVDPALAGPAGRAALGTVAAALDVALRRRDVTERVARIGTEFVATVSHELRTPLTSLVSFACLLADAANGPLNPTQHEFVDVIDRNAKRLLRLIQDLLLVVRLESGALPLEVSTLDIAELVRGCVAERARNAAADGITLACSVTPGAALRGDHLRIRQVLDCLVDNAVRFTPPGGRVAIDAVAENAGWRLTVRDTGVGIAAEELKRMFESFARGSNAAGLSVSGLSVSGIGLGLTIARAIVALHGGQIELESADGAGTTVAVWLPYQPAADPPRRQPSAPSGDRMTRLLVVEDDKDIALALRLLLSRSGYSVEHAADGRTGLRLVYELRPDLLVLDIGLPTMDGWQVLARVRDISDVPVLLLTARGQDSDKVRGLRGGADDYLTKRSPTPSCWPGWRRCCGGPVAGSGWVTCTTTGWSGSTRARAR
jgi:signal transduction histidine kinase/CheY-like chemotaxis protein